MLLDQILRVLGDTLLHISPDEIDITVSVIAAQLYRPGLSLLKYLRAENQNWGGGEIYLNQILHHRFSEYGA